MVVEEIRGNLSLFRFINFINLYKINHLNFLDIFTLELSLNFH